jgi:hypothetical protein
MPLWLSFVTGVNYSTRPFSCWRTFRSWKIIRLDVNYSTRPNKFRIFCHEICENVFLLLYLGISKDSRAPMDGKCIFKFSGGDI